jgi:hypothetical protein
MAPAERHGGGPPPARAPEPASLIAGPDHQALALALAKVLRSAWRRHQGAAAPTDAPAGAGGGAEGAVVQHDERIEPVAHDG